jgi:hypothetical protein
MSPTEQALLDAAKKALKPATEAALTASDEFHQKYHRLLHRHKQEATKPSPVNYKRADFSGHVWVRVAGLDVEMYDMQKHQWDIVGIYGTDKQGKTVDALNHRSFGNDQVVYPEFQGHITPDFHSPKALIQWVRWVARQTGRIEPAGKLILK